MFNRSCDISQRIVSQIQANTYAEFGATKKMTAFPGGCKRFGKIRVFSRLQSVQNGTLERFKKYCRQFGARIFGFWRGFGEGAGLKNPVTEPKRSQKPKRPLSPFPPPNGYSIFYTTLAFVARFIQKLESKH
jgi:hypothetical protein